MERLIVVAHGNLLLTLAIERRAGVFSENDVFLGLMLQCSCFAGALLSGLGLQ
jgi:hypothetical protein